MNLLRTNQRNPAFQQLVAQLDAELAIRDGDDHAFYHQFNGIARLDHVVLLFENNLAVGCGAFKIRHDKQVEIKRMFVVPAARNKGYAAAILNALERWAAELGFGEAILETGKAQIEALAFYPKQGYTVRPNFPPYTGIVNSVCFKKTL